MAITQKKIDDFNASYKVQLTDLNSKKKEVREKIKKFQDELFEINQKESKLKEKHKVYNEE